MSFVAVSGYGGGDYTPEGNLAEWIDRVVLGHWRDGAVADAKEGVISSLLWIETVYGRRISPFIIGYDQSGNCLSHFVYVVPASVVSESLIKKLRSIESEPQLF